MPNRAPLSERVHIPLRKADVVRLDVLARRRDVPRAQVIREAIRDYLTRQQAAEPRAS